MERGVILCVFVLFMVAKNGFAETDYKTEWMMHWRPSHRMPTYSWRPLPRVPFPWALVERCQSAFHGMPSCMGEIQKALRRPNEAVIISDKCCKIVAEIDEECFVTKFVGQRYAHWLMHHCGHHHNPAPTPSDPVPEPPTPIPSDPAPIAPTPTPIDFAPPPDIAGGDLPAPTPSPSPFASYYF